MLFDPTVILTIDKGVVLDSGTENENNNKQNISISVFLRGKVAFQLALLITAGVFSYPWI